MPDMTPQKEPRTGAKPVPANARAGQRAAAGGGLATAHAVPCSSCFCGGLGVPGLAGRKSGAR